MRKFLYATTALAFSATAAQAQTTIIPGQGTLTDAAGNHWTIAPSGSIMEGNTWTPGGGGTAALTIVNGVAYGLDAHGRGWFKLSGNGQYWTSSPAPSDVTAPASTTQTIATTSTPPTPSAQAAVAAPRTQQATQPCTPMASGAATGQFTTSNGQIIGPDGKVFIAKGINLYDSDMGAASQVLATFPGINFIRLATYSYQSPSAFQGFVQKMASAGVVVEIEHHMGAGGGVPALTGGDLAAENAWFQSLASAFKNMPSVWFGTLNEPAPGGGLANEQSSNYQTIRSTGNTSIIMISEPVEASTNGMTNVVVDKHEYGWTSHYNTDQNAVTSELMNTIKSVQSAAGNIPLIIGETGPATDGQHEDANAQQVLSATMSSGYGAVYWNWDSRAPQDNLTQGGQLTSYGQTVAGWIALVGNAPASIWSAAACATTAATTAASGNTIVAQTDAQLSATASLPNSDTTALDAQATAQHAVAQTAMAQADAQAPANAAAVQQGTAVAAQASDILAGVLAAVGGGK